MVGIIQEFSLQMARSYVQLSGIIRELTSNARIDPTRKATLEAQHASFIQKIRLCDLGRQTDRDRVVLSGKFIEGGNVYTRSVMS